MLDGKYSNIYFKDTCIKNHSPTSIEAMIFFIMKC